MIVEYFLASDDGDAAGLLDSGPDGVIGPDPYVELATLEAILLGLDPAGEEALALMRRPDHAAVIARYADDTVTVIRIADHTVSIIAEAATAKRLSAAMGPWAQTEEFTEVGVTARELTEMFMKLHVLFLQAHNGSQHLYTWTCA